MQITCNKTLSCYYYSMTKPITRKTKLYRAVCDAMQIRTQPLTLQEILAEAKVTVPNVAFSSVYRTIQRLENDGLVVRIDWRERGSRYEWAEDPHHHLVCQRCGAIRDLHDNELNFCENQVAELTGYLVKRHSIELEGICPACQKH